MYSEPEQTPMTRRVKELDGIRGFSLLLIFLWHYIANQAIPDDGSALDLIVKSLALTWGGVDLFFVLSGFVIVSILLNAKGSDHYFRTFYIRRACRILPLYLLVLSLYFVAAKFVDSPWLFDDPRPLLSYFTFTQNFFMHTEGFGANWLGVTWTLAVEEQFYLLVPILVWRLNRKQLFLLFAALVLMAPIFRMAVGNLGAYVFPFARTDSIFMGGLLAIMFQTPAIRVALAENYRYVVGAFFIFLMGCVVMAWKAPEIGGVFSHLWLGSFLALLIAVNTISPHPGKRRLMANPLFVWLGLRSYAAYLFHQPVSGMVHHYMNGFSKPVFWTIEQFQATLIALLITLLLAELSYRYFESIFIKIGKRYKYRSSMKSPDTMYLIKSNEQSPGSSATS